MGRKESNQTKIKQNVKNQIKQIIHILKTL